ncbi:Na+/H+ antiporter subunit D [Cesiribacter andamanensis]|uniref:Multiple resistance and pH homeostasis protein D n=1 Tax=Cesiribacter andamanensis AMV16 TaxID=1279009 RepID=M7N3Q6_9BACT|nr:Na+/H+ antiporter subunit D [Cesiribacter andamanensis]EMR01841.1 Multiple resistance and pH homeostasis protein D [Cesiribacter andamanensis AMV16]
MSHLLLVLPLLIPLFGAILCLFFWYRPGAQKILSLLSQLGLVSAAVWLLLQVNSEEILTTQIGNWPAPFGITLVADLFGSLMVLSSSLVGLALLVYSLRGLDAPRQRFGYYPLLLMLQLGIGGACLTGDLFNLFVWFEVLLICCFVLISLGGTRAQLEGSIKYVTINILASSFLLMGIGVVYGILGTLNMAELAQLVRAPDTNTSLIPMAGMFFLVALGIKAAVFPLFFWLPASYHTPPIAISAFIGGLLTKVGVYALVRVFTLIFAIDLDRTLPLIMLISGLTMLIGVLGAAAQTDFRKILSFHIISQIGYMIMGLSLFTPLALAGTIFFIIHNILVKTNLFLISGVVAQRHKSFALPFLGGAYLLQPVLALLFVLSAFSLAGIPPFSGFWGKFMLAKGGFEAGQWLLVGTSLGVSLLTVFSMTKIWNEVFWKNKPQEEGAPSQARELPEESPAERRTRRLMYVPVLFLSGLIVCMGLYADPLISLSQRAAEQLLNSDVYINAVMYPPK